MSLWDQAKLDAASIIADVAFGFARSFSVTNPDGFSAIVPGFFNDIHRAIDPETGLTISAQTVTFVVSAAALDGAGFTSSPSVEMATGDKPWVVSEGAAKWRVKRVEPDGIGLLTLYLEKLF